MYFLFLFIIINFIHILITITIYICQQIHLYVFHILFSFGVRVSYFIGYGNQHINDPYGYK